MWAYSIRSLFRVRQVAVVGNAHTPSSEVLKAAGLARPGHVTLMLDAGSATAMRARGRLALGGPGQFTRHWPWT